MLRKVPLSLYRKAVFGGLYQTPHGIFLSKVCPGNKEDFMFIQKKSAGLACCLPGFKRDNLESIYQHSSHCRSRFSVTYVKRITMMMHVIDQGELGTHIICISILLARTMIPDLWSKWFGGAGVLCECIMLHLVALNCLFVELE